MVKRMVCGLPQSQRGGFLVLEIESDLLEPVVAGEIAKRRVPDYETAVGVGKAPAYRTVDGIESEIECVKALL